MYFPRSKFIVIFTLILLCKSTVFSQNLLRQKAEENPLSTVLYLLSTTEKDSKEEEKACLATSFARAERFNEIENAAKMIEEGSYVDGNFVALANDLITIGKAEEASKLISFLITRASDDEYLLQKLFKPLILLKRDNDAAQIIAKFSDSEKIDGAFELAKVYLELGQAAKALDVINGVTNLVEQSEYDEDKADLGFYYAKLGKEAESLRFLQKAMKNLVWKSGKPEYTEGRILHRVVETYRVLGKINEANELLVKQGESAIFEELENLIEIAGDYLAKGNNEKAFELIDQSLNRLNLKEYGDSFDLGKIIELYLKLGETGKAEKIARSLTGNDYIQQLKLLNIADLYIKNKNNSKASEILNFALEQTKKIDTSEEESGRLWTSGKWKQAQYQSQIALRFIDMKADKKALELISNLKKPYLRALILTEFISVNKNRIPSAKLNFYLEEALSLLRQKKVDIFDSKRFDVYAIAARSFAEIGEKEKSNDIFAETLSTLSKEMIENGSDSGLLFAMCNIGVEFDKSKIKPNEKLRDSLRQIIKSWENEDY